MLRRALDKIHGKMILPSIYFFMKDRRFKLLEDILQRDEWSVAQIEEHQAQCLSNLFRISHEHNPYWREQFNRYGLTPNGGDPFKELAKLPILTKDELRTNWRRMRSSHMSDKEVIHETSSGSTGMPVNVYHSKHYHTLDAAMNYRMWAWMGIDPGEPYLTIGANGPFMTPKKRLLRSCRLLVDRGQFIDGNIIDDEKVRHGLRKAMRRRPSLIHGYVTALVEIARIGRELGLKWDSIRAVATTSECLFDRDREFLGEVFDAPVFDRYGSREVSSISMQCERGGHHVFADMNVVEFLPWRDADSGLNAIVVTPLENDAMPMFRYRNGDSASGVQGTCPCGKALPLMTACSGRICGNILAPDGRLVHGTYFLNFFYYQEGFKAWQFHQTSRENIDLYVVPDGMLSEERQAYLSQCLGKIKDDFEGQFHVRLRLVDEIPRTPAGKHLYTISDVLKNV